MNAISSRPLTGRRIGILTASASRQGGGVFEAVVAQGRMIRELGGEAMIFALQDDDAEADRGRFAGLPVGLATVRGPRQIGYAPDLPAMLLAAELDCLHLHGIWMYPSAAGSNWARRTGRPYFISPHGMLDPWITARGRWKKALARTAYERAGWRRAAAMHALTLCEAADIRRESGRNDSIVIPNAGPIALPEPRTPPSGRTVVYIGRIHAKKNLLELIAGWQTVTAQYPEARLMIAGWGGDGDVTAVRQAIAQAGPSIEFVGPAFGTDKANLLAGARYVVLPSQSEGLPMAVLEAWAMGIPTIMTGQCNLPEGFAAGAAIECGYAAPAIGEALARALGFDDGAWLAMSDAARSLAAGPFSSHTVAAQWADVYCTAATGSSAG